MPRDRNKAALPETSSGSPSPQEFRDTTEARLAYYRDLVDTAPAMLFEANRQNFQFTFVSAYAENLLGYPALLWTNQPSFWKEHVWSEDLEGAIARRNHALQESSEYDLEYRMMASDGTKRWVRELGRLFTGEDGERQIIGVLVDLSKKRSSLGSISDTRPWLRQVIDTIPAQIWGALPDGALDFWNLRLATESGVDVNALRGDGWQQMLHPDDRDRVIEAWQNSVKNGTPYGEQLRLRVAGVGYRWFLGRAIPLRDENGNILRWFGCAIDIDDQKRIEQALRESEQRWRAVFQNAWVGVALLDSALRFVEVNAALERILGYTRSELQSMTTLDVTCEDDRESYKVLTDELIGGKRDYIRLEKRNCRKNGDLIWVRLSGSPVDVRGSRLWIIVTEDITESKRLQDNLALERDRLRLLLDLNHQLISKLDLRDFAEAVLDGLSRVAGWEWGTVLLPEPDSDRLTIYLHRGGALTGGSLIEEGATIPIEGTLCGKVYRSGQPATFRTRDLPLLSPEYARDAVMQEASRVHKLENGCILPLLQGTKVLGVLYLLTASDEKSVSHDLEFLQELASLVAAALSNCLQFDQMTASRAKLASEKQYIEDQVRREAHFDGFVGESAALKEILRQAHMVASTDATVLVIGETGTGKELIARAVHDHSPRHEQSFIKVDCAAIPSSLLESELFGHERGAFTGAIAQKLGRFETADGGTLFLDEVGEIPLELQPKLLRVLQDRAFERVGSNRARQIDVRIIAATNRNLEAMVNAGKFREDLYYRLKVFPIVIPPLRDRPADIAPLVRHYVAKYALRMKKHITTIPSEAMELFRRYAWPGNVRELQHFIERAVILTAGSVLRAPLGEITEAIQKIQPPPPRPARARTMEEIERESILQALRESNWVVGGPHGAAAKLGLKRTTLASRIERLGISRRP